MPQMAASTARRSTLRRSRSCGVGLVALTGTAAHSERTIVRIAPFMMALPVREGSVPVVRRARRRSRRRHDDVRHHALIGVLYDVAVVDELPLDDRIGERDDHLHLARLALLSLPLRERQADRVLIAGELDGLAVDLRYQIGRAHV